MSQEPAQITFTTNVFASPAFLGPLITVIASLASAAGVHVLDNQVLQQQLILVLGVIITGWLHWQFPGASGKLGVNAPAPWKAPSSQDIPAGASLVTVAAPTDIVQATAVRPLPVGSHVVDVMSTKSTAAVVNVASK